MIICPCLRNTIRLSYLWTNIGNNFAKNTPNGLFNKWLRKLS
jgi:hypothetical protein